MCRWRNRTDVYFRRQVSVSYVASHTSGIFVIDDVDISSDDSPSTDDIYFLDSSWKRIHAWVRKIGRISSISSISTSLSYFFEFDRKESRLDETSGRRRFVVLERILSQFFKKSDSVFSSSSFFDEFLEKKWSWDYSCVLRFLSLCICRRLHRKTIIQILRVWDEENLVDLIVAHRQTLNVYERTVIDTIHLISIRSREMQDVSRWYASHKVVPSLCFDDRRRCQQKNHFQ